MKKIFVMMIALMMILTVAAMGATNLDKLGINREAAPLAPITGEWSATGYYDAQNDSVNEIYLDVLVLEFEGNDVYAGIYTENGGARYQEIVTYHDGYLTFEPDGVYATETFVVFPMEGNLLGAYQSADGKLFAEDEPVDFYVLEPRDEADIAGTDLIAAEADLYDIVVYLMGDHADKMTVEDVAELAGYTTGLEAALADLFGVDLETVNAFTGEIMAGLKAMTEEDKAELDAAFAELGGMIDEIPEEDLAAADKFINDMNDAIAGMTDEEIAELEAMLTELGEAVAEIPEEDLIAAGEFMEEVFDAIAGMTDEEIAELEAMLTELGEAVAEIPEEDLEAAAEFVLDALEGFAASGQTASIAGPEQGFGFLSGLML